VQDLLSNPAVQGGVAPFVVGLLVALLLHRVRLGGLAVVAAFCTTVYFVAGFTFTPLTATRKIVVLGLVAPIVGFLADSAFKPTRIGNLLIAIAGGASAVWVFWSVLIQREVVEAVLLGGGTAAFVALMIAIGLFLSKDPVRASSAALTLGLAAGLSAWLGASAVYALYGIALGAGAGAFLLLQMVMGKKIFAGATLTLPAMVVSSLLASGTVVLAKMPWYALPALSLVPVATMVPLPEKTPIWLQGILRSVCGIIVAVLPLALTWQYGGETTR
jgi:hypothetical protein